MSEKPMAYPDAPAALPPETDGWSPERYEPDRESEVDLRQELRVMELRAKSAEGIAEMQAAAAHKAEAATAAALQRADELKVERDAATATAANYWAQIEELCDKRTALERRVAELETAVESAENRAAMKAGDDARVREQVRVLHAARRVIPATHVKVRADIDAVLRRGK
jgi:hypothetical protein